MLRTGSVTVLCLVLSLSLSASELDNLAKNLKSRDVDTRVRTAESLGRMKSAAATPLLVQALGDKEGRVRAAAARGLWDASDVAKDAIPALKTALGDPDPYVVGCAAGALLAMDVPAKDVAEPLRGVLTRGDAHDRFLAARLLIGTEPAGNLVTPIVDYLRKNLPDSKSDVEDSIDRSHRVENATEELINLGKTNDRTQIDPLMKQLAGAPAGLIPPIIEDLGQLKPAPDHWTDTLITYLGSPSVPVRKTAVEFLGKQKAAVDVAKWAPAVARLSTDPDADVRGWVLSTLKEGKGLAHDGFSAVIQMVRSEKSAELRTRAAEVAGDIGDAKFPIDSSIKSAMAKEGLPVLSAAIEKDPDDHVRGDALHALAKLQLEPSVLAPIIAKAAVEGKGMGFRTDALIILRNLGDDASMVRATIEPMTKDPDPDVARIAKATIESISSPSPVKPASRVAAKPAAVSSDPAVREKGLAYLREHDSEFTASDFARALTHAEHETVSAFLDAGMSPEQRFSYGTLPLQLAMEGGEQCGSGTKEIVRLLLARGADPKAADDNGNTILMTAAQRCDADVIRALLKAGAKVDTKNKMSVSALEFAIMASNAESGNALIAGGARLTAEKANMYRENFAKSPKMKELLAAATKK